MPGRGGSESTGVGSTDRRALASVATQFFVNGAVFASFVPRLPEIRDRLDITVGILGALLSLAGLFGMAGSWLAGRLIERFGTRRVMIVASLAPVIALPIIGFATGPLTLLFGLSAMFAFDVLVDIAMNLQGSWLSGRRHAPVMNRLHGLWSLGTVFGGLVAARVAAKGVPLSLHLTATAVTLAGLLVFVGRGLLRKDEHQSFEPVAVTRPRFARPSFVLLGLAGAFAVAVEVTSTDWAAFRLADDFGASAGFAGLGFVAFTAGMTGGRLTGDWVLHRLGPTRLLRVAVFAASTGLAGAALIPNRAVTLASYLLAGLGVATFFPKLYDDAARTPGRPGAGLGALTFGTRIGALAVPAAVGAMATTSLSVGSAIAIVTLPSVLGFVVALAKLERPGKNG